MNNPLWMKFGPYLVNMNNVLVIEKSPGGLLEIKNQNFDLYKQRMIFAPRDPGYAALNAFYEIVQPWAVDAPPAPALNNAHGTAQRLVSDATREGK